MPDIANKNDAITFTTLLKQFKSPIHEDNVKLNTLMNNLQSGNKDTANAYDTGARVHLSYPLSGPGNSRKKPETPRASVLIYHSGIEDETQFTRDIQTFVMNAFNGLTEETVSVLLYPGKPVIDLPPQPEAAGLSPLFLLFPAGIMLAAAGYFCRAQLRAFLMRRKVKQHE